MRVREGMAEAANAAGRDAGEIKLVAAAKMNDAENVRAAIEAGVDAVGENRVQEMLEKNAQGAYVGAPLHFIGHLQSNKVNKVVGLCEVIESVGSVKLLEEISRRAVSLSICQNIFIEVNIGDEAAKSGIAAGELGGILEKCGKIGGIKVTGLMAIPPFCDNSAEMRHYFDMMYNLFVDIRVKKYDNVSMQFLSMGMSASYRDAIMSGANIVRVGSLIFGERQKAY